MSGGIIYVFKGFSGPAPASGTAGSREPSCPVFPLVYYSTIPRPSSLCQQQMWTLESGGIQWSLSFFFLSLSLSEPIFKTSWWTVSHSCSHSVTRALPCVLVGHAWATRSFLQPAGTTWDQKRQFPSETTGCWTDRRKGPQQRLSREAF